MKKSAKQKNKLPQAVQQAQQQLEVAFAALEEDNNVNDVPEMCRNNPTCYMDHYNLFSITYWH